MASVTKYSPAFHAFVQMLWASHHSYKVIYEKAYEKFCSQYPDLSPDLLNGFIERNRVRDEWKASRASYDSESIKMIQAEENSMAMRGILMQKDIASIYEAKIEALMNRIDMIDATDPEQDAELMSLLAKIEKMRDAYGKHTGSDTTRELAAEREKVRMKKEAEMEVDRNKAKLALKDSQPQPANVIG